jgi:hypothetical protein
MSGENNPLWAIPPEQFPKKDGKGVNITPPKPSGEKPKPDTPPPGKETSFQDDGKGNVNFYNPRE